MNPPKLLLYTKTLEVTVGIYAILADYCDVDIVYNFEEFTRAVKEKKYDLLVLHSETKLVEAKEEYQKVINTCGLPCLYLTKHNENVLFAPDNFKPAPTAILVYPLTIDNLTKSVEKSLGIRLRKKRPPRKPRKSKRPLVLILGSKDLDGITAKTILREYCDVIKTNSTLEFLRCIAALKEYLSLILISSGLINIELYDDPALEITFEYMKELAPTCPIGWISWKKNDLKRALHQFHSTHGLVLDGEEGFTPKDIVQFASEITGLQFTERPHLKEEEHHKRKILVVDDEASMRQTLQTLLAHDFEVFQAANEKEAVNIYQKEHSKLSMVILDLRLGSFRSSGARALLEMKKINRQVPVVLMTGCGLDISPWGEDEPPLQTFYLAADDLLIKPFEKEDFDKIIEKTLFDYERFSRLEDYSQKMLVIDDSKEIIDLMRLMFLEYVVESSQEGELGLAMFRREKYDVVILDYHLPDIKGIEILKEIRSIDKSTRVIMLTIEKNEKIHQELLLEGAEKIVHKPVNKEEIIKAVREVKE